MSAVQLGYYLTEQGVVTYHLAPPERAGRLPRPLCGSAPLLKQGPSWGWTGQALSVERARARARRQRRRFCRRCDQLAEALRDPVTRLGDVADG